MEKTNPLVFVVKRYTVRNAKKTVCRMQAHNNEVRMVERFPTHRIHIYTFVVLLWGLPEYLS